jgi:3-hydroxybutyryl-CoA dehydratase
MSDTMERPMVFDEPLTLEQIEQLPLYEWDVAEIGHRSPAFSYEVTAESIADYCKAVRNDNPLYLDADAAAKGPFGGIIAPPTYVFKCAPLRRNEVMHAQGYASPEEKRDRATPYAKSEILFQRPIRVGDTITSTVELIDKYERRGNQFITWKTEATNQNGEKVVEYTYTIIWRRGQKDTSAKPAQEATAAPAEHPKHEPKGESLPIVTKVETQEAIDQYAELTRVRPRVSASLHSDPEFAQRTIFGGTVNMGVATAAYCAEVLEKKFGPGAILKPGSRLEYKGIRPIHADTRITLSGHVVNESPTSTNCEIHVHDDKGTLLGLATATVSTGKDA